MNSVTIEHLLQRDGEAVCAIEGNSMEPLLRERRDTVRLIPADHPLCKYDVALYRNGDHYTLHRVVKVYADSYVMCGDRCTVLETGIPHDAVVGVMAAFVRRGHEYTADNRIHQWYARLWVALFPFRVFVLRVYAHLFQRKRR